MLYVALGAQAVLIGCAFWLESRYTERTAHRAVLWSIAWLAFGLLPTLWFGLFDSARAASSYAAVYSIERALSLDNVFVFAVLIATFQIQGGDRERLVSLGALSAFALRVPAILLGVALFKASHVVSYLLGGSCSYWRGRPRAQAIPRVPSPTGSCATCSGVSPLASTCPDASSSCATGGVRLPPCCCA